MYKKKLHREEQINKNYLPIFQKKIKALKYLHQTNKCGCMHGVLHYRAANYFF